MLRQKTRRRADAPTLPRFPSMFLGVTSAVSQFFALQTFPRPTRNQAIPDSSDKRFGPKKVTVFDWSSGFSLLLLELKLQPRPRAATATHLSCSRHDQLHSDDVRTRRVAGIVKMNYEDQNSCLRVYCLRNPVFFDVFGSCVDAEGWFRRRKKEKTTKRSASL